jgi:hypothetical protein
MSTRITKIFNAVLFLYLLFVSLMGYLFDPESHKRVPWDDVYTWSPSFAIIAAFCMGLFLIFWGAAVVKIFWNRFIADVFKIRTINYDEALAISLMLTIFFL